MKRLITHIVCVMVWIVCISTASCLAKAGGLPLADWLACMSITLIGAFVLMIPAIISIQDRR